MDIVGYLVLGKNYSSKHLTLFSFFFFTPSPLLNGDLVLHLNKLKKKNFVTKCFVPIQVWMKLASCFWRYSWNYTNIYMSACYSQTIVISYEIFAMCIKCSWHNFVFDLFFILKLKINLEVMNKLAEFLECFWKSNSYTFFFYINLSKIHK